MTDQGGTADNAPGYAAFKNRDDLDTYGDNALLLFVAQMRLGFDDVDSFASNSLTDGSNDKKCDLVAVSADRQRIILAQGYMSERLPGGGAPANKASDLNRLFRIQGVTSGGAGWRIKFAHRTFQWDSEAPGKAAVHCVIIGFTRDRAKKRRLWDYLTARSEPLEATGVRSINAYLVDGPEILVGKRTTPLAPDLPMVDYRSKPADGGNLIITPEDYDTVMADPVMAPYVRPYVGSKELLSDRKRWCLWLPEMDSSAPARSPELKRRLEGVAAMREASSAASTRDWARFPRLFRQTGLVSDVPFVGIPEVSSENRYYLPVSHLEPEVIISNKVYGAVDPNGIVFAVASSSMFWTWMKTVGGRMKSDPSFSSTITWNNFPMPALTSEQRAALASAGAKILDARDQHPGRSLEDHYTPLSMTPELVRAHDQLDTVMDKIIGAPRRCRTILERQELLFASYVRMTSNVSAAPRAGLVPQPILAG